MTKAKPMNYYNEQHRPQFHFSPESMWMNDPNGMVYHNGVYHLFYQYHPDSTIWGPMHWGHAISRDLVYWEHLPIALYPDDLGYIFSGSAVVDERNTSGFARGANAPIIAIFTHHLKEGEAAGRKDYQCQSIAYSLDNGKTWTKYKGNPVLPNTEQIQDFRDPKVFWHKTSEQWVMILAAGDRVMFYNSPDLKSWTFASDFGPGWGNQTRSWECPDLFELAIEGTRTRKWVMLVSIDKGAVNGGSGTQYFIGDFDGKTFTIDEAFAQYIGKDTNKACWVDWGKDNYAGVTWANVPARDGRRLFIAWMSNWQYAQTVPTAKWRSAMTIPRTLSLRKTAIGTQLIAKPVKGLAKLRGTAQVLTAEAVNYRLAEVVIKAKGDVAVEISNNKGEKVVIGYEHTNSQYYIDRSQSGKVDFSDDFAKRFIAERTTTTDTVKMHLFIDVASVELFGDDGACAMTGIFFPSEDFNTLRVVGEAIEYAQFYELRKIW